MFDNIIHIRECNSTNTSMMELNITKQNEEGIRIEEGTVIYSDFQKAGKGQRGNGWEAEDKKNLLFSIILYPDIIQPGEQFILSQLFSLAVADCLKNYTEDITIKWPNDIYWKERKICGILVENQLIDDRISQSIAGIGININQTEFRSNAPNPVSLKQITNKEYDIESILKEVLRNIYSYYMQIVNGDITLIINSYKDSLFRKDGYHLYNDGNSDFLARIKDIEPSGILVLETKDSVIRRFAFKEVKYILG